MRQHLFRGRGVPDFVPSGYSHMYLDLETMLHWLSTGNTEVSDWSGPFATEEIVQKAITDYAAGVDDLATKVVQVLEPMDIPERGRYVTIDPTVHAGKLIIIKNTGDDPRPYRIELLHSGLVRLGAQIWVYNDSGLITSIHNYNSMCRYPLSQTDHNLEPQGVMIIRPVQVLGEMITYLISGEMNGTVPLSTEVGNGIDEAHREDLDNPHQVDKTQVGLSKLINLGLATPPQTRLATKGGLTTEPESYVTLFGLSAAFAEFLQNNSFVPEFADQENAEGAWSWGNEASDSLLMSPLATGFALNVFKNDVTATRDDSENVVTLGEEARDDLFMSPRSTHYALQKWAELNPSSGASQSVVVMESVSSESTGYNFQLNVISPNNKFIELTSGPHSIDGIVTLSLSLDGLEDYPVSGTTSLFNNSNLPVTLYCDYYGEIIYSGVPDDFDTTDVTVPVNAVVHLKKISPDSEDSPRWVCWGDFSRPNETAPAGGAGYLELEAAFNGSYDYFQYPDAIIGSFVRLLPDPEIAKESYSFLMYSPDGGNNNSEFTLFNNTTGELTLYFAGYSEIIYGHVSGPTGFQYGKVVVPPNGVVKVKLLKWDIYNYPWLVSGDLIEVEVPV